VGDHVKFEDFKKLYYDAWKGGAKGCTTFRASGKRFGVLNEVAEEPAVEACFIDPQTGTKTCE
jgi:ribonucleoside-diphosphate reductase alpha chain